MDYPKRFTSEVPKGQASNIPASSTTQTNPATAGFFIMGTTDRKLAFWNGVNIIKKIVRIGLG